MKKRVKHYIIIGSSRGLGAATVEELLKNESNQVIGVARSKIENIESNEKWVASKRYRHVELDINSSHASETLKSICSELHNVPICIILNAAFVKSDVNENMTINFDIFDKVNQVGVTGLRNVIQAFEDHLLTHGGIFVGISSVASMIPPVFDLRIAYPASKAYLDMTFRCLRTIWDSKKIATLIIHLGHMGNVDKFFSRWIVPSYTLTAKKIIRSISGRKIPKEITYPILYSIIYKYILAFFPDSFYFWLFRLFAKIGNSIKESKQ